MLHIVRIREIRESAELVRVLRVADMPGAVYHVPLGNSRLRVHWTKVQHISNPCFVGV